MEFRGFLGVLLLLGGCAANEPSHVPNPLLLPVHASSSALDNAIYNQRRGKVARFVTEHHLALVNEISGTPGPYLGQAMTLAHIPETERGVVSARLARDVDQYAASAETLIVALMVHGA